ncbi:MAG TPA: GGDEF domain-containing protein [Noviherbaspirillum sp.]
MQEESSPSKEEAKETRRQYHRRHIAALVVFSTLIETAELALFALGGNVSLAVVGLFFVAAVGSASLIYLVFRLGWNQRFKNKNLLIPQLIVAATVQLSFLLIAPQLAVLFLVALIVLSAYAVVEFSPRQFTIGWLIYGAVTAMALWLVRDRFAYPGTSGLDIAALWLFCFLTLRSLTWPSARFSALRNKLSEKNRQLEESLRQIEALARHDSLTGVLNHRNLIAVLESELQRSARTAQVFCFVMVDLDHFKSINDTYGHPAGDAVLRQVCEIAGRVLRTTDAIGRLGGEEFAIILPATTRANGEESIERLRQAIVSHDWESIAPDLKVSFSAGIAEYLPGDSVQSINKRADQALYRAKDAGRNRIVTDDTGQPLPKVTA